MARQQTGTPLETVNPVVGLEELMTMQSQIREIHVHDSIREYIVDVVRATRETNQFAMGASPRGSLLLMRAAQGHAAMNGGDFVRPDDVKSVAPAVLAHRVLTRTKGIAAETIINALISELPTPVPI